MVQLVKIVSNDAANKSTTYMGDDGKLYTLRGDLAARSNNPGNISPTGTRDVYESQFGAIGYLPSSKGEPAVAVFPTLQQGQAAQAYLWSTPAYQNKTIAQAASSWASAPYPDALAAAAGASKDTLVKDLTPQQITAMVNAQSNAEGSSNLRISDASGNPVSPTAFQGNGLDAINAATGGNQQSALGYADNTNGSLVPMPRPRPDPTPAFYGRLPATAANGVDRLNADGSPTPTPTDFTANPVGNYDPSMQGMLTPQAPRMDPVGSGPGTFSQLQSAFAVPPPLPIPRPNPLPPVPASRNASIDMVAPGNIDLNNRPVYFGNDGTYGTEHSFSIGTPKGEVLIPQIVNGKLVSQQDAINHYMQTGENLGTFTTPAAADAYATQLHERDQGLADMPVPMSGRPAALSTTSPNLLPSGNSWTSPGVQSAAPASSQHLVNLNGKMVAVGTYPSPSNPGSTFTVSDDGTGKAVVKNNDLGFMNPAKMGAGTVASGVIGKALSDTYQQTAPEVQKSLSSAASNVGATASQLGSNISSTAQNLAGGALTAFSNLFGGGNKAPATYTPPSGNSWVPSTVKSTPTPPASILNSSILPTGSSWTLGASSPAALGQTSPVTAPSAPVQQLNPAYTAWQAQYGNQGGLATGTSENTVSSKFNDGGDLLIPPPLPAAPAPVVPPAPPKYITVPRAGTPPGTSLNLAPTPPPPPDTGPSYITAQNGMNRQQTQDALMAQQNRAVGNANPNMPTSFASDNFSDKGASQGATSSGGSGKVRGTVTTPAVPMVTGRTGRSYQVGQTYTNNSGSFIALANGQFRKVA